MNENSEVTTASLTPTLRFQCSHRGQVVITLAQDTTMSHITHATVDMVHGRWRLVAVQTCSAKAAWDLAQNLMREWGHELDEWELAVDWSAS